jgi:hypothetical protein
MNFVDIEVVKTLVETLVKLTKIESFLKNMFENEIGGDRR